MKRISLLAIALLALTSGMAQASAREYRFTTRPRVRWSPYTHSLVYGDVKYSPYAKEYGSSGLVYRRTKYNPRAKKYGSSGLVYDNVRYSPYALGYNRSGLVSDPRYGSCKPYSVSYYDGGPCIVVHRTTSGPVCTSQSKSSKPRSAGRNRLQARAAQFAQSSGRKRTKYDSGCKNIIEGYLILKNIDYELDRLLSIEGSLISIDFVIDDGKTVVKYWNPQAILNLKKQQNPRISAYENYLESYGDYCGDFRAKGGKFHQIISADEKEVLKQLIDCEELNREPKPQQCPQEDECTAVVKADIESPEAPVVD